jgi:hypothetical protein
MVLTVFADGGMPFIVWTISFNHWKGVLIYNKTWLIRNLGDQKENFLIMKNLCN